MGNLQHLENQEVLSVLLVQAAISMVSVLNTDQMQPSILVCSVPQWSFNSNYFYLNEPAFSPLSRNYFWLSNI